MSKLRFEFLPRSTPGLSWRHTAAAVSLIGLAGGAIEPVWANPIAQPPMFVPPPTAELAIRSQAKGIPTAPAVPLSPVPYRTEGELMQQASGSAPAPVGLVMPLQNQSSAPQFRPPGAVLPASSPAKAPPAAPISPLDRSNAAVPLVPSQSRPLPPDPLTVPQLPPASKGTLPPPPDREGSPRETAALAQAPLTPDSSTPSSVPIPVEPAGAAPATSSGGAPLPPLPPPPQAPQSTPAIPPPGAPASARPLTRSAALTPPSLRFQGVYIYQGNNSSARARVTGFYPIAPNIAVGATIDFTKGNAFVDSRDEGISINELYVTLAPSSAPNLRLVVGQLDLTSYFDRNSFAKDGATHFFNSVFQTNPALAATGINSRQAALVNWSVNDNLEAKAAIFSSARSISNFELNGFAGELGLRYGNLIVRGTYASDRDGGGRDGFREIFQFRRSNGDFGTRRGDREEAYGVNAEYFVSEWKMGIFGRYGHYQNRALDAGGDTFNVGVSFLDLLTPNDRLGFAYGRELSNDKLRRRAGDRVPDVFEAFYDFAILPNLRLGFSYQAFQGFSESIFGVRVKTEFDMVAPRR